MNLPRFIAARFIRPGGGFLSFLTFAAASGIALAVAVLLLVLSVANGFEQALREDVLPAVPQLTLDVQGADPAAWAPALAALPGVAALAPTHELGALALKARGDGTTASRPVNLLGVDPSGPLRGVLPPEAAARLAPGSFGVFLGQGLAKGLGVGPGDRVTVVVPTLRVTLAGAFPVQRRVAVLGLLETGTLLDGEVMVAHLDDVRALDRRSQMRSLRLWLDDVLAVGAVRAAVDEALETAGVREQVRVSDWRQRYGGLFEAITVQKKMLFLVLTLLVAMAAFNLIAMLLMVIRQQAGPIAMLSTLGLAGRQLRAVFCWHGGLVAGGGIGVGVVLGLGLCVLAPPFVAWLSSLREAPLMAAYFVDYLPVAVAPGDVLAVALVASALAALAIGLAARRAEAVQPQEVLRHE